MPSARARSGEPTGARAEQTPGPPAPLSPMRTLLSGNLLPALLVASVVALTAGLWRLVSDRMPKWAVLVALALAAAGVARVIVALIATSHVGVTRAAPAVRSVRW